MPWDRRTGLRSSPEGGGRKDEVAREEKQDEGKSGCQSLGLRCSGTADAVEHPTSNRAVTMATTLQASPAPITHKLLNQDPLC